MSGEGAAAGHDQPSAIGRYRIVTRVAGDALSDVYSGFDPLLERPVVVKAFQVNSSDPAAVAGLTRQFFGEVQRISALVHPGIVPLFDAGECPGGLFMASEFVEGGCLAESPLRGGTDVAVSLALLAQIVEALEYAHALGVPHLSLKPTSVMVTPDAVVKVGGFGVAGVTDAIAAASGVRVGKPSPFMAPERVSRAEGDQRSDVFALAAIALDLLSAQAPDVLGEAPRRLPALPAPLSAQGAAPERWAALFARALADDPAERFQTAAALQRELLEVCGVDVPALPLGWEAPGHTDVSAIDADSGDTETALSPGSVSAARTTEAAGTPRPGAADETRAARSDDDQATTIARRWTRRHPERVPRCHGDGRPREYGRFAWPDVGSKGRLWPRDVQ